MKRMLRRDRSSEEKQVDRIFKGGMLKLGAAQTPTESTPKPFPHYLFWDVMGRKGQRCRVVNPDRTASSRIQVEFEDGAIVVVSRLAIRRI